MRKLMVALVLVVTLGVFAAGASANVPPKPPGDPGPGCHWVLVSTADGWQWGLQCGRNVAN